jgi:CDP-diacylglycerol--serine O-phosphatidyltransferase
MSRATESGAPADFEQDEKKPGGVSSGKSSAPKLDPSRGQPGLGLGFRRRRRKTLQKKRGLRLRRHGRRAYIRSVYFLPSMATLGNAVCGFGSMYVAAMASPAIVPQRDILAQFLATHRFFTAAYLIFLAMVFDALDGRLARFARHTTDFGGQLDSLADVISFGAAPAFMALQLFKAEGPDLHVMFSRLLWAIGAMYMSCAAIRLARFNVSNEHGEQHHFSFLGLPSPGAGGAVAGLVLMQQQLRHESLPFFNDTLAYAGVVLLPFVVLCTGLLMVSHLRYPHLVNRYLKGRRSIGRLIVVLGILLMLIVAHQYTLGIGALAFAAWGPTAVISAWIRRRTRAGAAPQANI